MWFKSSLQPGRGPLSMTGLTTDKRDGEGGGVGWLQLGGPGSIRGLGKILHKTWRILIFIIFNNNKMKSTKIGPCEISIPGPSRS